LDALAIGEVGPEFVETASVVQPEFVETGNMNKKHEESAEQGISYEYYEGNWNKLPDYESLIPAKTGLLSTFDTSVHVSRDNYGFRFSGNLKIETPGNYTFYTASDDGSLLRIDGNLIVDNNDGEHSEVLHAEGDIFLSEGQHAIQVDYYKKDGAGDLEVAYSGPGVSKQAIPASLLSRSSKTFHKVSMESMESKDNSHLLRKKKDSHKMKRSHHKKHDMPPYLGVNYIIALTGVYPEDDVSDDYQYDDDVQFDREDDYREEYYRDEYN
jgi:hypothetical protein